MKIKSRNSTLQLCILILIFFSTMTLSAEEEPTRLFLWETRIGDAQIYMAGSIHILTDDFYPLPQPFYDAVDHADYLLLEADVSSIKQEEISALVYQYGMYQGGSTLADDISGKLYEDIINASKAYGLPEDQVLMMKPWLLSLTFGLLSEVFAGYDAALGMEMVLAEYFSSEQILELEGAAFQIEMLGSLNVKDQILLLESSLDASEDQRQLLTELIDSWKDGDDEKMQNLITEPDVASGSLNRKLITDRNSGMVEKILEITEGTNKTYLVLVGSAHFLGDESIPSLLEAKGFEVMRILSDGSSVPR